MYTSDKSITLKHCRNYLKATVFCAFFGAVYEKFSHEVYSYFMIYAFAIPLVMGALPLLKIAESKIKQPDLKALYLYNSGVASLTIGSIFRGVLEIYGTTNSLSEVYFIAGTVFIVTGFSVWLFQEKNSTENLSRLQGEAK